MKRNLFFDDFIKIEDTIWFANSTYNAMFSYNLRTGVLTYRGCFEGELIGEKHLFASIEELDKRLFFFPFNGKNIQIYDLETEKYSCIELPGEKWTACKFYSAFKIKNECYLLPTATKNIYKIDLKTYKISVIDDANLNEFLNHTVTFFGNCFQNNEVYVTYLSESNTIFVFDKIKKFIKVFTVSSCDNCFISVAGFGTDVYFLCRNSGKVLYFDLKGYEYKEYNINYQKISKEARTEILEPRLNGSVNGIYRNDSVYLFPDMGSHGIQINILKREAEEIEYVGYDKININSKIKIYDDIIYFFSSSESALIQIDPLNKITKTILEIDSVDFERILELANKNSFWKEEETICTLNRFLNRLDQQNDQQVEMKQYGLQIYSTIREENNDYKCVRVLRTKSKIGI